MNKFLVCIQELHNRTQYISSQASEKSAPLTHKLMAVSMATYLQQWLNTLQNGAERLRFWTNFVQIFFRIPNNQITALFKEILPTYMTLNRKRCTLLSDFIILIFFAISNTNFFFEISSLLTWNSTALFVVKDLSVYLKSSNLLAVLTQMVKGR